MVVVVVGGIMEEELVGERMAVLGCWWQTNSLWGVKVNAKLMNENN